MSDNPLVAAPVIPPAPAGETLPAPTLEQEQAADQLFSRPEEHHAAADLLGMVAATQLLHDLAIETYCRRERSDEEPEVREQPALPETDAE